MIDNFSRHYRNSAAHMAGLALIGVVSTAYLGTPAHAVEPDIRTEIVRYDDLDLTAPAGVKRLSRRVDAAAKRVCGAERAINLTMHMATRSCRKATLARANRDVELAIARRQGDTRLAVRGDRKANTRGM